MQPGELARILPHLTHLANDLTVFAVQKPNVIVPEVGNIEDAAPPATCSQGPIARVTLYTRYDAQ